MGVARNILHNELLFGKDGVPAVPWVTLRDNATETMVGWSFLVDGRTVWPVDGKAWVMQKVNKHTCPEKAIHQRASRSNRTMEGEGGRAVRAGYDSAHGEAVRSAARHCRLARLRPGGPQHPTS